MAAVPPRKRSRAEQVVPTFASVEADVSTPRLSEEPQGPIPETSDYPIPNFEELYNKMREADGGVAIEDRRWRLLTYQMCFVGSELVDWLVKNVEGNIDRTEAVELGQKLLDAGILHHVMRSEPFADDYYFYRFQEDEQTSVLNMKRVWDSTRKARFAVDVSVETITRLACLCEEHRRNIVEKKVSTDPAAGEIDYAALARSEAFRQYVLSAAELQAVEISSLDSEERLAFFVNIYNALCLHGHVLYGAPTNFLKRMSFFRGMAYRIGGLDYTLDDIEHGILRGNKRPPSLRFMQQLRPSDPKCQHILSRREERIHCVISAGTPSDPPIRILDMENLHEELNDATEEFLEKTVKIDAAKKEVTLPRIFSWYSDDFPRPERNLLGWINGYLKRDLQVRITELLNDVAAPPTIIYQNFDWTNSEARFNAAVVRRKRRRLNRQMASANGDRNVSPNILSPVLTYSPALQGSRENLSPPMPEVSVDARISAVGVRGVEMPEFGDSAGTPPLRNSSRRMVETPALSGASGNNMETSQTGGERERQGGDEYDGVANSYRAERQG
mmetsp:Transcript_4884/g.21053  ORF Transcript_4884/g.21053 Transcript_4884/m.21053 type:complete len:558 (-) Transcript_4884:247-1920(-)|eukprot:CAMPEP_0113964440 /NCGR_PEP_ID=MMETSP0011_2-20120614/7141_1 /TAXON_ID=101924 /ORGANISM="Rhodosorus marinus" /LENGTH=557 /DNA_ID=CAMNT_0000976743 /DNA_START=332 /DNA_END=2005 /DNA_ORIENTATION=- /assembly_acc=CAM_ASM_000156